ncbi:MULTISPECIES: hypothetical protein [Acinetobacter]|uniref:Uncharacterized protein n=1 Tax=Acinetobacter indicus TaxID=756892 RepID=A0A6C0Y6U7_9GAMM|nr:MULTISPECIES: hypothetical protein [Acinetobacter]QIC71898.1 hypothetical protein FSC09_16030 [Acinetobacter indicus]QKQ71434.1 hypothetical protein E5Y90_14480 [Acinetobacter sp. 10FS3-1]
MKKLMKSVAVILGLGLVGLTTTNAQTPKSKAPGEICYAFNSQGLLGEWKEELLVSKKKLTDKQAAAYMQKNHGMSEIYDIEELDELDCDAAVTSYSYEPGYLHYYKEPKKAQAQPVKKTTTTNK